MLKRRDSGMTEPQKPDGENTTEENKPRPKYSVSVYIIVLFAAVMLLILLSYFVQQRNSSRAIDSITEQHDKFSTQALESIEELQEQNLELLNQIDEAGEQLEKLEAELDKTKLAWTNDVKNVEDSLKSDYNELLLKQQAVGYLLDAELALDDGDKKSARESLALLEATAGSLDERYRDEYERLQGILG